MKPMHMATVSLLLALAAAPALASTAQVGPAEPETPAAPAGCSSSKTPASGQTAARFQVWGGAGATPWLAEDAIWISVVERSNDDIWHVRSLTRCTSSIRNVVKCNAKLSTSNSPSPALTRTRSSSRSTGWTHTSPTSSGTTRPSGAPMCRSGRGALSRPLSRAGLGRRGRACPCPGMAARSARVAPMAFGGGGTGCGARCASKAWTP